MDDINCYILVLTPQFNWDIMGAELKKVTSLCRYMNVEHVMHSEWIDKEHDENLYKIATLCEELLPYSLYTHFANKKVFRRENDFWASDDKLLRKHIKKMADIRLTKAIMLADSCDIAILYTENRKAALHIDDRLKLCGQKATPVMNFRRKEEGTEYRLQVRIGEDTVNDISRHKVVVLSHTPGTFILDGNIYFMDEKISAQLLIPFIKKPAVWIASRNENNYFRHFILKNAAKVEMNAEGFDIEDMDSIPHPKLQMEASIGGYYILSLHFDYDGNQYLPDDTTPGRVTLRETSDSFKFTRQLRDRSKEQRYMEVLNKNVPQLTSSGYIQFGSLSSLVEWLQKNGEQLRKLGFDVVQPSDKVYYIGPLSVEQSDKWEGDWLQTRVTIVIDGGRLRIPFNNLRSTILRGEQEFMLQTGERLIIPSEWLERYIDLLFAGVSKEGVFIRHRSQLPLSLRLGQDKKTPTSDNNRTGKQDEKMCSLELIKTTLRPYQLSGLKWLWQNYKARTGCCLSDDMGLGKTIQTIALLLEYKATAKAKPGKKPQAGFLFTEEEMRGDTDDFGTTNINEAEFRTSLVVAPASVVHNWYNELTRFAPSLMVCNYTGEIAKRQEKRHNMMRWDVVLTSYRTLVNDIDFMEGQKFGIIVFDECQTFKTSNSQIHQAVSRLSGLHQMALSGTPIENNLEELWSLMSVLNPYLLGDKLSFKKKFITPISRQMDESRTVVLKQLIAPYFLKRTKEEVLADLPERQDEVVICPMTENQVSKYATELSSARNEWLDPTVSSAHRQIHILSAIQRLRHIANGEGKMNVVMSYLENIKSTNHKVLLFSEYVSLLKFVGEKMRKREWKYEMLTGETRNREQVIANFQNNPLCQFFLISLKAGGVGLNLTSADYVFLLDPWWNKSAEEQAIARSHRIGQHNPVFVYRFIAEGTLEQQILSLQDRKQNLIDSVMPFIL